METRGACFLLDTDTEATNTKCSEFTAGGVQSHISTTNSQQRLRPAAYVPLAKRSTILPPTVQSRDRSPFDITGFLKQCLFPTSTLPVSASNHHPQPRPWSSICLKWAAITYCILSVVLFSVEIHKIAHRHKDDHTRLKQPRGIFRSGISPYKDLSIKQRLSRISSHHPVPESFDAFLIRASDHPSDSSSVTACMWTTELNELELLYTWASLWRGPISLLMTTTSVPKSVDHKILLQRLRNQKERLSRSGISVHLLHVNGKNGSPNSYLNMARLFAPTSVVMLVPSNLSVLPSISYDDFISRSSLPASLPSVVSSTAQVWSSYSELPVLSPVIIQRNHSVWCTDRFFIQNTRALDWKECLWQLWVESFGEFNTFRATIGTTDKLAYNMEPMDMTRSRFSTRFRAEICDLTARTMASLGLQHYKNGKKKLMWLKQTCGQRSVERMFKIM